MKSTEKCLPAIRMQIENKGLGDFLDSKIEFPSIHSHSKSFSSFLPDDEKK
jgi:hypothetical protein